MSKSPSICFYLIAVLFAGVVLAHAPLIAASSASALPGADQQKIITREVRHELLMLPRYSLFDWIEYEVRPDDSVILRGQVLGFTLKADAEAAVKRVEGVTGVVNQIEELPPSPIDDQIRRRVYRAIYSEDGPLFRYAIQAVPSIHIIVKNGNVTLKGVVDSQADMDFAYAQASSVPQVFKVQNDLSVEKPRQNPGGTVQ